MRYTLLILVVLLACFEPACDRSQEDPLADKGECPFEGALRCADAKVERCVLGAWVFHEECPDDTLCGQRSWFDDIGIEVSNAYCASGEITSLGCNVPDEVACVDDDVMRCLKVDATGDKGSWWRVTSCQTGQACEVSSFAADDGVLYQAGFCVEKDDIGGPCNHPGESRCVDSTIVYCGPHHEPMWFAWLATTTCVIGSECVEEMTTNFAGDEVRHATCQEGP